jgi:hypothetical protein
MCREDSVGNIFGRLEGSDPSLGVVLTGSHCDAIPLAGGGVKYSTLQYTKGVHYTRGPSHWSAHCGLLPPGLRGCQGIPLAFSTACIGVVHQAVVPGGLPRGGRPLPVVALLDNTCYVYCLICPVLWLHDMRHQ